MDFSLSQEHIIFQDMLRKFISNEIDPIVEEYDRRNEFPMHLWSKSAEIGLFGLQFSKKYGTPADNLYPIIASEELSRSSIGIAGSLGMHCFVAAPYIIRFGTEEQKKKYIPPAIKGEEIWALGMTEPDAGSDFANISTTAVEDGNDWVINGTKMFITNGTICSHVIVVCNTSIAGKTGMSLIIVDKDSPGFSSGKKLDKLGWRTSDTAELVFENCRVPKQNLLGDLNRGFYHIMEGLVPERLSMAAMGVGLAQACYDACHKYAKERHQFNKPIGSFQATGFKIVDMAMEIQLARIMTYYTAWLDSTGKDATTEVCMAKTYASEVATRAAVNAVQIFGGYGFMMEYPVQRFFRDTKVLEIGGGTSEIQRNIILKRLGFH